MPQTKRLIKNRIGYVIMTLIGLFFLWLINSTAQQHSPLNAFGQVAYVIGIIALSTMIVINLIQFAETFIGSK
jgi:hypothetical protein